MLPLALLPDAVVVSLDGIVLDDSSITLWLRTSKATACCPDCAWPSHHVHSRYPRRVRDLPYQGRPTFLHLTVRKFFCRNLDCSRAIFCEPIPDLVSRYAQSTSCLTDSHRAIALALGGEPGARLAAQLGMPTSADTLLRRIKQTATQEAPTPRVLGVDDWAIRKGDRYGTILVDLERGQVIDLLVGRDGAALQQWLADHPGVKIISRDRAIAYAQAASTAAPAARQVDDRWHLLKNVREMLERFLERHRVKIQMALTPLMQTPVRTEPPIASPTQQPSAPHEQTPVVPLAVAEEAAVEDSATDGKRQRRQERYHEVRQRHSQGESIRLIAVQMNLSRGAVRRYLRSDHCPDWRVGQTRRSGLDGFSKWIDEQIQAGRDNAAEFHRELRAKGYQGSAAAVRRFVTKRLALLGKKRARVHAAQSRSPPQPSARQLAFDLLRVEKKRKAEEQRRVDVLRGIDEEFAEVLRLVEEFIALIRKEKKMPLSDWLRKAEASASAEMRGFAVGMRQDESAVSAAMTEVWSNGPVEGQVNRLKTIKRQMYGRASFGLLRLRVLNAG